jgi:hypothetical protein
MCCGLSSQKILYRSSDDNNNPFQPRQSQASRTKIDQFVTTKFYQKLPFSIYYFGEGMDQKEITLDPITPPICCRPSTSQHPLTSLV